MQSMLNMVLPDKNTCNKDRRCTTNCFGVVSLDSYGLMFSTSNFVGPSRLLYRILVVRHELSLGVCTSLVVLLFLSQIVDRNWFKLFLSRIVARIEWFFDVDHFKIM